MNPPPPPLPCYPGGDKSPSERSLRGLDRIHVSSSLKGHLSSAFTSLLCRSGHTAVVVTCELPVFHAVYPRFRFDEGFLSDDAVVESLLDHLNSVTGDAASDWEAAHALFWQASIEHKLSRQQLQ